MKIEKQVKYTYTLTDKEKEFVASLKDIGEQLDTGDIFNCPRGCNICPFDVIGEACILSIFNGAITEIINITNKIEKGETICQQ